MTAEKDLHRAPDQQGFTDPTASPLHVEGIPSRRWPVTIKNYWFGQRPSRVAMPDIARLYSIPAPISNARNVESWTLLTDLSGTVEDLISGLSKYTRKQVRRAEREGITVERLNCRDPETLYNFGSFWNRFAQSKADVRSILNVSVKLHMLQRLANASMLEMSRASGPDGEPLVYHVFIVAEGRARVHHSASLFRDEAESSAHRHVMAWSNRFLHWQNMLYYRQRGCTHYDLGGWYAGKENESLLRVNQFKEEFGGNVVCEYDAMVGCSFLGRSALWAQDQYRKMLHRGWPSEFIWKITT